MRLTPEMATRLRAKLRRKQEEIRSLSRVREEWLDFCAEENIIEVLDADDKVICAVHNAPGSTPFLLNDVEGGDDDNG